MEMFQTKITGTGHFAPEKILTNDDLSKMMDTSHQWIVERTGIHERRICDLSKGETPTMMAYEASKQAIEKSGIDPNEIDMIMFSVTVGDMHFPNSASVLQHKLGITNKCACIDISAACTGWVYGMVMANSLIQTGAYKNILLIGCEMTSAFNDWKDRSTSVLFGDGAGATLLSRAEAGSSSKIHHSILGSDSSKKDALILKTGGSETPVTKEILDQGLHKVEMNGAEVFKAAVKTMCSHSGLVMEKTGWNQDDLSWFIPHQANQRIIEAVAHRFKFPIEKVVSNVKYYANTSSASIPIALNETIEAGKLKRGDNLLFAAFGAGLTSGALSLTY